MVIIPVVLMNHIVQYKETTLMMDLISILCGNLFIDNPIYVVAWYITFISLIYLFLFSQFLVKSNLARVLVWISGFMYFSVYVNFQFKYPRAEKILFFIDSNFCNICSTFVCWFDFILIIFLLFDN